LHDRFVERHGGDGRVLGARACRKRHFAAGERFVQHHGGADLIPVVVFRVDPENDDARNVVLARDAVGELQRSKRLEQREHRTAEQSRLLTGDDRDCLLIGEQSRGLDGLRRRAAPPLLSPDDVCDLVPLPIVGLRSGDCLRPRRRVVRVT
jgi:hypothetical protein